MLTFKEDELSCFENIPFFLLSHFNFCSLAPTPNLNPAAHARIVSRRATKTSQDMCTVRSETLSGKTVGGDKISV